MFPSSLAHCSPMTVAVLVVVTIVTLTVRSRRSPMPMKLNHLFIGSNRLANDGRPSCSKAADDYFNRRYFDLKNYSISNGDSDLISQNRTPVKVYTKEDVVKCFDLLSSSPEGGNHRPMHFAFVGDSTIRQHFFRFLEFIPDYDRITKTTNQSWFIRNDYFHEDHNVTSSVLHELRVSYYWRFLIIQDVLDNFKPWATASSRDNETSPDFILLGITAHHVDINSVTDSLEMFVHLLEHKLIPLIKKSLAANPRQKIVWLLQSRTILQMTPKVYRIHPDDIFKYNKEIRRVFEGTGVVIWDSINPIVEEDTRACTLNEFERSDKKGYTRCYDFIHPGLGAVTLGTHLIFNHLCGATGIY